MRRTTAPAALVAILLLAGCGSNAGTSTGGSPTRSGDAYPVKVDTAKLRLLKQRIGIEPCPRISGTEGAPGGLPAITLPCLGGGAPVDLAGLRGPLVLNFWAQTCGPCRDESPLLQEFAERTDNRVRVMGVDFYDPRPGAALDFARQLGITYPQLADPEAKTRGVLKIVGLPITFLIDRTGRIAYTKVGAIESTEQLSELVHDHLGVDLPGRSGG